MQRPYSTRGTTRIGDPPRVSGVRFNAPNRTAYNEAGGRPRPSCAAAHCPVENSRRRTLQQGTGRPGRRPARAGTPASHRINVVILASCERQRQVRTQKSESRSEKRVQGQPRVPLFSILHSDFCIQHSASPPARCRSRLQNSRRREREGQWVSCEAERGRTARHGSSTSRPFARSDNEADGLLPFARQTSSMIMAAASPPPMQIAASPRLRPRSRSAWIRVTMRRAPLAPMGCPRATAPPLTLILS